MKIQDLFFLGLLAVLVYFRNYRLYFIAGTAALAAAIPLFFFWIFFTAERLTWYAGAFFLSGLLTLSFQRKEFV